MFPADVVVVVDVVGDGSRTVLHAGDVAATTAAIELVPAYVPVREYTSPAAALSPEHHARVEAAVRAEYARETAARASADAPTLDDGTRLLYFCNTTGTSLALQAPTADEGADDDDAAAAAPAPTADASTWTVERIDAADFAAWLDSLLTPDADEPSLPPPRSLLQLKALAAALEPARHALVWTTTPDADADGAWLLERAQLTAP